MKKNSYSRILKRVPKEHHLSIVHNSYPTAKVEVPRMNGEFRFYEKLKNFISKLIIKFINLLNMF